MTVETCEPNRIQYSPIEHLAKTVALSSVPWQEVLFVMFTACFDAGGNQHDQRFLVVAGFISSADAWIKFDEAWRCRLKRDGISYFHMVEFAHFRKAFKTGWKGNEPRRHALLSDLMDIIRGHASRKFGCVIENKQFKDLISKEQREKYYLDAYSFAGLYCAHQVNKWRSDENISTAPQLVFEDGDLGKGHLMDRLKRDGFGIPIFRLKKDEDTLNGKEFGFTPLQAADFLAYEILLANKKMEDRNYNPRWGMEQFHRMMGDLVKYNYKELCALNEDLPFSERMHEWWKKIGVSSY